MMFLLNRILLFIALHFHLLVIVTMEPPLQVHLFGNYDDAIYYAWHPVHPGCMVFDGARDPEWIMNFREQELDRYEDDERKPWPVRASK